MLNVTLVFSFEFRTVDVIVPVYVLVCTCAVGLSVTLYGWHAAHSSTVVLLWTI